MAAAAAVRPDTRTPRPAPGAYRKVRLGAYELDPPSFVKMPKEFAYLTGPKRLQGLLQGNLIFEIALATFGNEHRPEWAQLTAGKLARKLGADRKSVVIALDDAEARGLIASRDRTGCGPTIGKMYQLTWKRWKDAPDYVPPAEPTAASSPEEDAEEYDETPTPCSNPESEPATVQPGKVSRPQAVEIRTRPSAEPVKIAVIYKVDCEWPLTFRTRTQTNGRLHVSVASARGASTSTPPAETASYDAKTPRHTAAPPECAIPNFSLDRREKGEQKEKDLGCTHPKLGKSDAENKQFADYQTSISAICLELWDKAADDDLIARIHQTADGAPVEFFQKAVWLKFKRPADSRRHSSGLLIDLAADANRAWKARSAASTPPPLVEQGNAQPTPFDDASAPARPPAVEILEGPPPPLLTAPPVMPQSKPETTAPDPEREASRAETQRRLKAQQSAEAEARREKFLKRSKTAPQHISPVTAADIEQIRAVHATGRPFTPDTEDSGS